MAGSNFMISSEIRRPNSSMGVLSQYRLRMSKRASRICCWRASALFFSVSGSARKVAKLSLPSATDFSATAFSCALLTLDPPRAPAIAPEGKTPGNDRQTGGSRVWHLRGTSGAIRPSWCAQAALATVAVHLAQTPILQRYHLPEKAVNKSSRVPSTFYTVKSRLLCVPVWGEVLSTSAQKMQTHSPKTDIEPKVF